MFQTPLLASPAAHINTLQDATNHCNTLQYAHLKLFEILLLAGPAAHSITATHCNTLKQTTKQRLSSNAHAVTRCNTLQITATRCNTLQHAATHCNALRRNIP